MSPDELNIKIELEEEVEIQVDNETSDVELIVDSSPDTIVLMPLDELNVTVENTEVELKIDNTLPDIDLILETYPDVIVLPASGLTGPQGPEGPTGPTGPEGQPGTQTTYVYTQLAAAYLWEITHNLDRYPSVTVIDSGDSEIIPDVVYLSNNAVRLYFAYATSGKAYLN